MRSPRNVNMSEKKFANKVQERSADIREALRICNIEGCHEPINVRKEIANHLRDNFVYQVDLGTMMKYIRRFRILKED